MKLNLSTDFCLLALEDVNYGDSFIRAISKFDQRTQEDLKYKARDYMKTLFINMQERLTGTLETISVMEPFCLPRFGTNPPRLIDFKAPFWDQDPITLSILEDQVRQLTPLIIETDKTEEF